MLTDLLLAPLIEAVNAAVDRLPAGQAPNLPDPAGWWSQLQGLDSLVPIMGPLVFMLGLLGLVVVFVAARLILTVWNLIWP